MFARVSTYQGPPEQMDEGINHARRRILPVVRNNIDGFSGVLFLLADRETGKTTLCCSTEGTFGAVEGRRP